MLICQEPEKTKYLSKRIEINVKSKSAKGGVAWKKYRKKIGEYKDKI